MTPQPSDSAATPLRICDGCGVRLARHAVAFEGKDTGYRRCCRCMDLVMVALCAEETAAGGDGPAGLAKFRQDHLAECGVQP